MSERTGGDHGPRGLRRDDNPELPEVTLSAAQPLRVLETLPGHSVTSFP